jgi:oligoendopeptidase F
MKSVHACVYKFLSLSTSKAIHIYKMKIPYLWMYKPHFFWQEFTLQNWSVAYTRNIIFLIEKLDPPKTAVIL